MSKTEEKKTEKKQGEQEGNEEGEGERESQLSQLAREYVKNLAKTVDNALCANIAKMQTLSKLNCAALDTYSKSYDALNQCLLDSNYDENKKIVLSIINEIDAVDTEVTQLEREMSDLDTLTVALEHKVNAALQDTSKGSAAPK